MQMQRWSHDPVSDTYVGTYEIAKELPSGFYKVGLNAMDLPVAKRQALKDDGLLNFRHGPMSYITKEVAKFWDSEHHYKNLGVTHKRGILLHGPAGCGKTDIVRALISDITTRGGLAVAVEGGRLGAFRTALPGVRHIEAGRQIMVVMEDLDNVCYYDEEELLEIMDGSTSLGQSILFVCTTNYLDQIPVRVRCRPSRIDTLIEVPLPATQQRYEYLKFICVGPFKQSEKVLKMWASKTKQFSLASLKELVISSVIYGRPLAETINRLKDLSAQQDPDDD